MHIPELNEVSSQSECSGCCGSLNRGISSSSEGSDKSAADKQREDILETGKRVDVGKVKDVPAPTKQKWWKPDPITGVWVPEDNDVHVDTAQVSIKLSKPLLTLCEYLLFQFLHFELASPNLVSR